MEMMVTARAVRPSKSCRHHQQTNTQLFTGECTSCCPDNSVRALIPTEGKSMLSLINLIVLIYLCMTCGLQILQLPAVCLSVCMFVRFTHKKTIKP